MFKNSLLILTLFTLSTALPSAAFSTEKSDDELLQEFANNPEQFMNELPTKKYHNKVQLFSDEEIANRDYVTAKNKIRPLDGRARIKGNDRPEDLVDNGNNLVRTLEEMEKLRSASLKENPWSDHYWPIYTGQIACRYADENFPDSKNWKKNADYILSHLDSSPNSSSVDTLSPAEKYDLLVGDTQQTLTHYALNEGEAYYRDNGKVEKWMGICHGWAPAAYMLPRPTHAIKVLAADGKTEITFYPADIKALASLLWANFAPNTKMIGGRCDVKKPKTDRNGRVLDPDCFDTNPGTWHMAVVNQIGINKRSFVIDATYDYEVWNQPMVSYSYKFFNPKTLKTVDTIEQGTVDLSTFRKDRFKKYRSSKAVAVVGIRMEATYVVESDPTHAKTDSAENDETNTAKYFYDVELNASGKIIGGEWYRNVHPDFMWTPEPGAVAVTPGDEFLARSGANKIPWAGKTPFPKEWTEIAQKTSQSSPLAIVVEALIQISQAGI